MRLVPYMLRNSVDEFKKRRDMSIQACWDFALTPARIFMAVLQ